MDMAVAIKAVREATQELAADNDLAEIRARLAAMGDLERSVHDAKVLLAEKGLHPALIPPFRKSNEGAENEFAIQCAGRQ